MNVGYLVGSFDMLNVSHLDLVAQVRELCESVVVGVLSDEDVVVVTGRSPLIPLAERLALVRALRGVDAAQVHGEEGDDGAREDPRVFVSEGCSVAPGREVVLTPRRSTASTLLGAALQDVRAASAA